MMKSEYLLGANTGIPDVDGVLIHEGDTLIMSENRLPLHCNEQYGIRYPRTNRIKYIEGAVGKVVYKDGSFYFKISQSKYCRLQSNVVRHLGLKAVVSNRHFSKGLTIGFPLSPEAAKEFREQWDRHRAEPGRLHHQDEIGHIKDLEANHHES